MSDKKDSGWGVSEEESRLIEWAVMTFVNEVLHGSEDHRKWLKQAGINFVVGKDVGHNNPYQP